MGFTLRNFPDGKFARASESSAVSVPVLSLKMR